MSIITAKTIPALLIHRVRQSSEQPALQFKQDDAWQRQTWLQVGSRVSQMVSVLGNLGVKPGDCVIQVAENCSQWIIADLAIQACGAIHVPVHTPLTGSQIAYQISFTAAPGNHTAGFFYPALPTSGFSFTS